MVKKSLSVFLSVLMVMSLVMVPAMGVSANAEPVDTTDYTPNLDDNTIAASYPSSNNGWTGNGGLTASRPSDTSSFWTITAGASQSSIPSAANRPTYGVYHSGTEISSLKKDTPYVIKLAVKQAAKSTAGKDPNLVYGFTSETQKGANGVSWTSQWVYTEEITSTDYQDVGQLFTLTDDSSTNIRLLVGLGVGNTHADYKDKSAFEFRSGASVTMDWSKTYLAPERAYDVINELSSTKVLPGAVVNANAKVVNQLGITGNLEQEMQIYAVDADKNVETGIEISDPDADGNYTITVGSSVTDGDYTILARSAKYTDEEKYIQTPVTLTVEREDYSDTEAIAGTDYITANGAAKNGTAWGIKNSVSNGIVTFTANNTQSSTSSGINRPCEGWYWNVNWNGASKTGDTWIISFKVKRASESVVPNLVYGLIDNASSALYSNPIVYAQDVASTEWQTVTQTFTLPTDGGANVQFAMGLGIGNTNTKYAGDPAYAFKAGASIMVDINSIYVGPESVADITNTAPITTVLAGKSISAEAAVVNAAGTKGTLDQSNIDVVVLNEQRTVPAAGITTTKGANGAYTINVAEGVAAGTYVAVASYTVDETTTLRKGLEFTVETIDKYKVDHEAGDITTNLDCRIDGSAITPTYGISSKYDATTNYKYRVTAAERDASSIPTAANRPMHGTIWSYNTANGNLTQGTTYVLKFMAKNVNEAVTPYVVFGLVHDGNRWTKDYVWAEKVASAEWQEFKKTFTFTHDGSGDLASLRIGLGTGSTAYSGEEFAYYLNASIDIDETSYYLAPEAFHDIKIAADKTVTRPGSSIVLDAAALNQVDMEGTLGQSFSWAPLNSSKETLADGITITPVGSDSSKVNVAFDSDIEKGTYIIAAYSKDYNAARHITITVSDKTTIENVIVEDGKVTFDAVNVAAGGLTGAVYVAEYVPVADTFVKAVKVPFSLAAGNSEGNEVPYTLDADANNEIRVYIWDNDLTPYIQPEVKKNS